MTLRQYGERPPQDGVPDDLRGNENLQDKLLYAAWSHGMREGDTIHRLALIGYIQTHLYPHGEEPIQNPLENSPNFDKLGDGVYRLNVTGLGRVTRFGHLPTRQSTMASYHLQTQFGGHVFGLTLDPVTRKLTLEIDGSPFKNGGVVWRKLCDLGACDSRKNPRHKKSAVWQWLLKTGFTWRRLDG